MKFILVQNAKMLVPGDLNRGCKVMSAMVELPLEGVPNDNGENKFREADLWKELQRLGSMSKEQSGKSKLGYGLNFGSKPEDGGVAWDWLLFEIMPLKGLFRDAIQPASFRILSGPVTNALVELFGNNVALQVNFDQFYYDTWEIPNVRTCEMKIQRGEHYACEDSDLIKAVLGRQNQYRCGAQNLRGNITVTVCVPEPIISDPATTAGPEFNRVMVAHKLMLQDGIGSDVVIKTGDGKQVKGHGCVLSTFSAVFKAMFETDGEESKTHSVEMSDVTEEGARALLAYLYCCEVTEPMSNPGIAVEMLMAGHKYAIEELESAMKKLILAKPTKWLELDIAVKLFLFANKLPGNYAKELKLKAVKALKMNLGYLNQSPTSAFVDLFKEDPESAMELCRCLCAV